MTTQSCGKPVCGCSDPLYQGTVIYDDRSEPGSWAQHIRDTECMRPPISPLDSNRRHEGEGAACVACDGSGYRGPYFPGGMRTRCVNCVVAG